MNIDSSNFTIAIVGYIIVFSALVLLYFIFSNIPKVLKLYAQIKTKTKREKNSNNIDESPGYMTGNENAAVATAIYLYFNQLHDEETTVLTIKKVKKDYSPWSSRVHSIHTFQK